jgi:hypothetical protein
MARKYEAGRLLVCGYRSRGEPKRRPQGGNRRLNLAQARIHVVSFLNRVGIKPADRATSIIAGANTATAPSVSCKKSAQSAFAASEAMPRIL